jgi:hypothetical protein
MQDREVSRRAIVVGLVAALALVFAPLDRFMAGLGRLLDGILKAPRRAQLKTYSSIRVCINGVEYEQVAGIDFGFSGDETALVIGRKPLGGGPWEIEGVAHTDGAAFDAFAKSLGQGA